jgi:AGZA family xanthine/uracil permease-like MFS transporter
MFTTPVIGIVCFAIILLSWFGGVQYYRGMPAGLVAIGLGSLIAWGSSALGFNYGGMSLENLAHSVSNFGFSIPLPAVGHVFSGFEFLGVILVTAIPFRIYDLVEALDNVESAAVAGDSFPTTRVRTADGVISLIGCLMGNPFINAVYIGHPGWKAMGGRIGYFAATGVMVILLAWFGIISVMVALIPVVAISPILLYIGMLIGAQAFQETPKSHAPAIILSLTPHLAAWGKRQIDDTLAAAGTNAGAIGLDKLSQSGILYHGLEIVGGGSILGGLVLAAIAAFIIDRQFLKAAGFALAGATLTFFGFMHGEKIGLGQTPVVAVSYFAVSLILVSCAKFATVTAKATAETADHAPAGLPEPAAQSEGNVLTA